MSTPHDQPDPLTTRVERLEELLMFADHRRETLAATVEELSRQIAALHVTIDTLSKRLKDAERTVASGDNAPTRDDEIPPHNAF